MPTRSAADRSSSTERSPAPAVRRWPVSRPPEETSSRTLWPVLDQHVDEAAAGWRRRARLVTAPHVRLRHLDRSDQRLFAHLAGVRVAGADGWKATLSALEGGDHGAVAVLAWMAFVDGEVDRMRAALPVILADPDFQAAGAIALAVLSPARLLESVRRLADSPLAAHRHLALSVQALQRRDPGPLLRLALEDSDPALRARALQAVGELGRTDLLPALMQGLQDADLGCRAAAAGSVFVVSPGPEVPAAFDTLCRDAQWLVPKRRRTMLEAAIRASHPSAAREAARQLSAHAGTAREAVIAVGAHGDAASVPWLIERMADPALARVAGEAVALVTGADLELQSLKAAGPYEDRDAEDVDPEDQDLPMPDAAGFTAWWRAHQHRFAAGKRYLAGQPLAAAHGCLEVLRQGTQRQRRSAALELCRLRPGTPLFAVEAFAFRQRRELGV